jgi:hypothetical protein
MLRETNRCPQVGHSQSGLLFFSSARFLTTVPAAHDSELTGRRDVTLPLPDQSSYQDPPPRQSNELWLGGGLNQQMSALVL